MRKFIHFVVICLGLVNGMVHPVQAKGILTPALLPGVLIPAGQAGTPTSADEKVISFLQLYGDDVQLSGPYDTSSQTFGLPANWRLTGSAQLDLDMTVSLNTFVINGVDVNPTSAGGMMSVLFNRKVVASFALTEVGAVSRTIMIPQAALTSPRSDGRMELSFVLDSGISCTVNQKMSVFIHSSSQITFPHDDILPDISLERFPFPLYQDTVLPESALVVIPDRPTAGEIQSALTVAAGLSNLSNSALSLELATVSQLTAEHRNTTNLILVGSAASMPLLAQLKLPLAPIGQAFDLNGIDDGVVEITNSTWNPAKVVLVVSGNSDAGIVKAAQAVTTGGLRTYLVPNLAVVQEIQDTDVPVSIPVTQTLTDLGYQVQTLSRSTTSSSGVTSSFSYRFFIPVGQVPTTDAYFELVFGQSALINYERSGAIIQLNGQPIGSIRMSDDYATNSVNKLKFSIPASAVLTGYNRLDVQVSLFPLDTCTVPAVKGLWFTVWPESSFYLPLAPSVISPASFMDLSVYPAPYVFNASLDSTAFIVQRDNFDTWRSAFMIAAYLGDHANGTIFTLKAFFGDDVPEAERASHDWIIIGQPSKMAVVAEINNNLPAPFANDLASEKSLQVSYRIPLDAPLGYVQLVQSPWNEDTIIIALLGNTVQGVNWAANALIDSILRGELAGNFAVINDTQVVSSDTRVTAFSPSNPALSPSDGQVVVPTTVVDLTPPAVERPAWILQAMLVSGGLAIFIILSVFATSWLRNRSRSK